VDIVPVARVERLATENPGILETVFTDRERAYCLGKRRQYEHLAARFAGKEAVLKAFGTGMGQRMRWTDVEIVNTVLGRPRVHLSGEVAAYAERHGLTDLDISLSHTAELAIAQVVAVWDETIVSRPGAEQTDLPGQTEAKDE
jgi:holo-[acyl-carrier protein] synthase